MYANLRTSPPSSVYLQYCTTYHTFLRQRYNVVACEKEASTNVHLPPWKKVTQNFVLCTIRILLKLVLWYRFIWHTRLFALGARFLPVLAVDETPIKVPLILVRYQQNLLVTSGLPKKLPWLTTDPVPTGITEFSGFAEKQKTSQKSVFRHTKHSKTAKIYSMGFFFWQLCPVVAEDGYR